MKPAQSEKSGRLSRRDFLHTVGVAAAGISLGFDGSLSASSSERTIRQKTTAVVKGAFVYPPTESLRRDGYYSWPGSTFDAEGRQKDYIGKIKAIERKLKMRIEMQQKPLDSDADTARFIEEVRQSKPDGLLLVPFKKGHWPRVTRVIEQTDAPAVVLATMGVLLAGHVGQLHRKAGVYMINAPDDFDAVEYGMTMIRTARRMKESVIINIAGSEADEKKVPVIGTTVRTVPLERFYEQFGRIEIDAAVRKLAAQYLKRAKRVVEPTKADATEAAKACFVLRKIIEAENADAVMMTCLPGLRKPHRHVPPCMGFMSLRDEGIPAGCESDLDATLTMMLLQNLFDRPAFQHNPSVDTERNYYFGAHCTCASRMSGSDAAPLPYILRSHAEAGWGCVPRVLFPKGQEITVTKYLSPKPDQSPQMIIYSGKIVDCPPIPPTGGCRTNMLTTINELDDICDLKGLHLCMVFGNYAKQLRAFCRLCKFEAVT